MAHLHYIEDETGDVVDHVVFCSDYCHKQHMDEKYRGWNGCNEISTTEPCVECGRTVEGLDEDEYYEPDESYAYEEKALSRAYAIDYST